MSIVDCDLQPGSTEPAIKVDASELKLPNATYAHTAFPSTKEQLVTDLSMSARRMKPRSVHYFAQPETCPSNQEPVAHLVPVPRVSL